jgi:phytol kinase
MIARDTGATLLSFGLAYGFVKTITGLAKSGVLDPLDSRKLIHTFSGPLFILVWPIFSAATGARFFAGIVPIVNALRLYLAAAGEGGMSTRCCLYCSGGF